MTRFPLPSPSSHSTFVAQLPCAHSFIVLAERFCACYLNQWDVNCGLQAHSWLCSVVPVLLGLIERLAAGKTIRRLLRLLR